MYIQFKKNRKNYYVQIVENKFSNSYDIKKYNFLENILYHFGDEKKSLSFQI